MRRPLRTLLLGALLVSSVASQGLAQVATGEDAPANGSWFKRRPTPPLSAEEQARREQLESVGYLGGVTTDPGFAGVTLHDPERALDGANFYTSGHGPEAILIDMEGNELHRWGIAYREAFPDHRGKVMDHGDQHWRRARLLDDGSVLAIFEGIGILKVDRDNNLVWAVNNRAHHDIELLVDGSFWTLTREAIIMDDVNRGRLILEDFLVRMDAEGHELQRVSILKCFERSKFRKLWRGTHPQGDLFHTNSVRRLTGRQKRQFRADEAGRLLISIRTMNALAVIDPDARAVAWFRQGPFEAQHDAQLLPSGNILVFDNLALPRYSSVTEFEPGGFQPRWEYRGSYDTPFFSATCGTASRLANGNTLIVESNAGRAFEVTAEKEMVWEFYNPHQAGEAGEFIANLFDLVRVPASSLEWLDRP